MRFTLSIFVIIEIVTHKLSCIVKKNSELLEEIIHSSIVRQVILLLFIY